MGLGNFSRLFELGCEDLRISIERPKEDKKT